ncbi:hypothetical protein HK098_007580 [Nowakowskiella sp. JEL0407]|nr:hypothetical protein HK098_007580 [Nowakowskiella sp. JEL0407]
MEKQLVSITHGIRNPSSGKKYYHCTWFGFPDSWESLNDLAKHSEANIDIIEQFEHGNREARNLASNGDMFLDKLELVQTKLPRTPLPFALAKDKESRNTPETNKRKNRIRPPIEEDFRTSNLTEVALCWICYERMDHSPLNCSKMRDLDYLAAFIQQTDLFEDLTPEEEKFISKKSKVIQIAFNSIKQPRPQSKEGDANLYYSNFLNEEHADPTSSFANSRRDVNMDSKESLSPNAPEMIEPQSPDSLPAHEEGSLEMIGYYSPHLISVPHNVAEKNRPPVKSQKVFPPTEKKVAVTENSRKSIKLPQVPPAVKNVTYFIRRIRVSDSHHESRLDVFLKIATGTSIRFANNLLENTRKQIHQIKEHGSKVKPDVHIYGSLHARYVDLKPSGILHAGDIVEVRLPSATAKRCGWGIKSRREFPFGVVEEYQEKVEKLVKEKPEKIAKKKDKDVESDDSKKVKGAVVKETGGKNNKGTTPTNIFIREMQPLSVKYGATRAMIAKNNINDEIEFWKKNPGKVSPLTQLLRTSMLYRDDDLIALNKPAGIPVFGNTKMGSVESCLNDFKFTFDHSPRLVQRMSSEASGVLLLARNDATYKRLQSIFKKETEEGEDNATIYKTYEIFSKSHDVNDKVNSSEFGVLTPCFYGPKGTVCEISTQFASEVEVRNFCEQELKAPVYGEIVRLDFDKVEVGYFS